MSNDALPIFINALEADGWIKVAPYQYEKNLWRIRFDTSRWMELSTDLTPRIFDVPVPSITPLNDTQWTINLINHLFTMQDRLLAGK